MEKIQIIEVMQDSAEMHDVTRIEGNTLYFKRGKEEYECHMNPEYELYRMRSYKKKYLFLTQYKYTAAKRYGYADAVPMFGDGIKVDERMIHLMQVSSVYGKALRELEVGGRLPSWLMAVFGIVALLVVAFVGYQCMGDNGSTTEETPPPIQEELPEGFQGVE